MSNNHVDSRGAGTHGSGHPAAERTSATARDGDDDTRTRKRKARAASAKLVEHAKTARAGRSSRHMGDRKARPDPRRSDEVRGFVVQTEIVHTDVLHSGDDNCRSRVGQVSQCRRERRVRGLEAVRGGMGAPNFGRGMWDS